MGYANVTFGDLSILVMDQSGRSKVHLHINQEIFIAKTLKTECPLFINESRVVIYRLDYINIAK